MQDAFVWTEQYSLGLPDVDREHQAVFRMAQALNEAMLWGDAGEELAGFFARLAAYIRDVASHVREHDQFAAKVAALEREFENGEGTVTAETVEFLRGWVGRHILGTDQRMARYLRGAC